MGIPNGSKVLAEYLRSVEGMPRIVNKTPADQTDPWVRIAKLGSPSETEPVDHLIRFMFQVDCFSGKSGGRPEAVQLASDVRSAIKNMPGLTVDAVTSGAECTNDADAVDTAFAPAREYQTLTFYIWMH